MMKLVVRYLYVLVALVLVASCSSTRKLEKTPMIGGLTGEAYMEKVIEHARHIEVQILGDDRTFAFVEDC